MAVDPRKRQKKLERKRAKDKAHAIARRRYEQDAPLRLRQTIAAAPVRDCCYTDTLWDSGMGSVLLSRELPNNQVAFAVFLMDVYCLGVKDAIYQVASASHYESKCLSRLQDQYTLVEMEPHCARKLVEGCVEYAQSLGFQPHADYAKARVVFGDIDAGECQQEFQYGKDGRPCLIPGPFDGPERMREIMRALESRGGAEGVGLVAEIPRIPAFLSESDVADCDDDD